MPITGKTNLINRVVTVLIVGLMALPFAACGGGGKPKKKKERNVKSFEDAGNKAYGEYKKNATGQGESAQSGGSAGVDASQFGPAGGQYDTSNTGTIKGVVKFSGKAPKRRKIDMSKEPYCNGKYQHKTETVIVSDNGELQNCVVYIEYGATNGGKSWDVPSTPFVLNQLGCRYDPHIVALRVGQTLEMKNDDPVMHNVHFIGSFDEWNKNQQGNKSDTRVFDDPDTDARFKCDVHGWMKAPAFIFEHPFFAVSGEDGTFEIKGVPPGKYFLTFKHEKGWKKSVAVEIGPGETKTVNQTFSG